MAHFINSFQIDVPSLTADLFRIDPQPPCNGLWKVLDNYESEARSRFGGSFIRHQDDGNWFLAALDADIRGSRVELDNAVLERRGTLELRESNERHQQLIAWELRDSLRSYLTEQLDYWKTRRRFYQRDPTGSVDGQDVYRGYKTGIDYEDGFYLTVDPTAKFISTKSVAYYLNQVGKDNVDCMHNRLRGRYCTLMSKDRPQVQLLSIADNLTVADETIEQKGEQVSVLEYLEKDSKYPSDVVNSISEDEPLARIRFHWMDEEESANTAPSLLHLNAKNPKKEVTEHGRLAPSERWETTKSLVEEINFLTAGGEYCDVADSPRYSGSDKFRYPPLQFGKNRTIRHGKTNETDSGQEIDSHNWGYVTQDYLNEFGPISRVRGEITVDLLYPEKRRAEAKEIYQAVRKHVRAYFDMELTANPGGVAYDTRQTFREWLNQHQNTCDGVLVVYDQNADQDYEVKAELKGLPAQGIQISTYRDTQQSNREFHNELFNVASGLVTKIGARPYLLDEGLNADAVLGISVKGGEMKTAGAILLSGSTGDIAYQTEQNLATGTENAASMEIAKLITKRSISTAIENKRLSDIENIVIHKNGTIGNKEIEGISKAFTELHNEHYLDADVDWCAVQISDGSRYRIYSEERDNCANTGSYAVLDNSSALITTYGKPDNHQGTPQPLYCSTKQNPDIDMESIAEDIFDLTFLNWGSPSVKIKQPVSTYIPGNMHEILAKGTQIQYPPL